MIRRLIASAGVVGIPIALALLGPPGVAAQGPTATAKTWTVPRTPDGQPDLQGFWNTTTYTPLERPDNVTTQFYTREEALAMARKAAGSEAEQTEPGTIPDVHYDFTQFGLDRSQGGGALNLRTSMIIDPPDGKLPPLSEEGKKRSAARAEARKRAGATTDAVQNFALEDRCILIGRRAGPPMIPGTYNNNYHVVQTSTHVMILVEMIHDGRVIPLDGRPHLPENVRQLLGSSRGHWDGDTLVVETRNFTDNTAFEGSSEHLRVTERFTRVDEDTIRYQFTVDDPSTWTRPWTAELPMRKSIGPLFEHACHEGNYPLYNTLAGARAEEKKAAEDAAAKRSN